MINRKKLLGVCGSILFLASCSSTHIQYPLDYSDALYTGVKEFGDGKSLPVVQNTKEDYYKNILSSDTVYSKTVNDLLIRLSKFVGSYDADPSKGNGGGAKKDVTEMALDSDCDNESVMNTSWTKPSVSANTNLWNRSKKTLLDTSKSGTYAKDNLFIEKKYADSLISDFSLPSDFEDKNTVSSDGKLITPDYSYAEAYSDSSDGFKYKDYSKETLEDDMRINYLTSEYIYTQTYSSIGNTRARRVQIVCLTDRSDEPGDAKRLIDAYIKDYVKAGGSLVGKDKDFTTLERLWKGITKKTVTAFDFNDGTQASNFNSDGRYNKNGELNSAYVLSDAEEAWLKNNNILSSDGLDSRTLMGTILNDAETLAEGYKNYKKRDTSLESSYTGTYTYDYKKGVRKAIDDLARKDILTKGMYLNSDGLSGIPTDLKDRIFSSSLVTTKTGQGEGDDITKIEGDGFRYLTNAKNTGTENDDNIVYYDSTNKAYYLTRVLDAVDSSSLRKDSTTSMYDTAEKKEQIAREVAYVMSTTGTYKTDSTIYWLRRLNFSYSDSDFLDYMKNNYKELFRKASLYDDYEKITLPND